MNNLLLERARIWLNESGVMTRCDQTRLQICETRDSLLEGMTKEEIVAELKIALNSTRLYLSVDDGGLYLQTI